MFARHGTATSAATYAPTVLVDVPSDAKGRGARGAHAAMVDLTEPKVLVLTGIDV